jgi:hypothetical protein
MRIPVSLTVTDSSRVLESVFRSALRDLPDIEVVTESEEALFRIRLVSLCDPKDCRGLVSYTVAITMTRPINGARIASAARRAGSPIGVAASEKMAKDLAPFEYAAGQWVTSWGSSVYANAAKRLVSEIDTDCFERERMYNRVVTTRDTATQNAILRAIDQREWGC